MDLKALLISAAPVIKMKNKRQALVERIKQVRVDDLSFYQLESICKVLNEQCSYPDCKCPFDMGSDNKCLRGLNNEPKAKEENQLDIVWFV